MSATHLRQACIAIALAASACTAGEPAVEADVERGTTPDPQSQAATAEPEPPTEEQRAALERTFGVPDPDATLIVSAAVDTARQTAGRRLLARIESAAVDRATEPDHRVTFVFASNFHAELDDCGCRSHPLGGVDRVATLFDAIDDAAAHPVVRLDTGNALARFDRRVSATPEEIEAARAMLRALDLMGVPVVPIGTHELSLGAEALARVFDGSDVAPLSANARVVGDATLESRAWTMVEAGELRVGLVGATGSRQPAPDWRSDELGWREPVEDTARAIREARDGGADIVVLLYTGGVPRTVDLMRQLAEGGVLPDVAFVSGSANKSNEPVFEAGVPILEAADRGRYVLQADIAGWRGEPWTFGAQAPLADVVRDWLATVTVVASTERNIRRATREGAAEAQIASYERLLRSQLDRQREVLAQMRDAAPWTPGEARAARVSTLDVTMHEVTLDLERHPEVAEVVDAAFAAGARH